MNGGGWGAAAARSTPPPHGRSSGSSSRPSTTSFASRARPPPKELLLEVYEHERWSRKADGQWIPSEADPDRPDRPPHWCTPQGAPHPPPEETVPPPGYGWATNWRVDTSASAVAAAAASTSSSSSSSSSTATAATVAVSFDGSSAASGGGGGGGGGDGPAPPPPTHDRQGWEYATSAARFSAPDRVPRGEQRWSDRARRRRWIRVAKARALLGAVTAPAELLRQAQEGLAALARGRRMLGEMVGVLGSRGDSSGVRREVFQAVELVRGHAREVGAVLQALQERAVAVAAAPAAADGGGGGSSSSPSSAALLGGAKKLLNDLQRERRLCEEWAKEAERKCLALPLNATNAPPPPPPPQQQQRAAMNEEDAPSNGGTRAVPIGSSSSSAEASPLRSGSGGVYGATPPSCQRATVGRAAFRPSPSSFDRTGAGGGAEEEEEESRAALLRQMRFQDEESVMEAIALEREEAITEVTRQLVELRDVFRDFAQLVAEQQEGIDEVARNVEDAHGRTKEGYEAVLKAEQHQREGVAGCAVM